MTTLYMIVCEPCEATLPGGRRNRRDVAVNMSRNLEYGNFATVQEGCNEIFMVRQAKLNSNLRNERSSR